MNEKKVNVILIILWIAAIVALAGAAVYRSRQLGSARADIDRYRSLYESATRENQQLTNDCERLRGEQQQLEGYITAVGEGLSGLQESTSANITTLQGAISLVREIKAQVKELEHRLEHRDTGGGID
jgi:chromosome segregation ATPase